MSLIRDVYENDEESHVDKKWKKLLSGETILNVSTTVCNDVSAFPGWILYKKECRIQDCCLDQKKLRKRDIVF